MSYDKMVREHYNAVAHEAGHLLINRDNMPDHKTHLTCNQVVELKDQCYAIDPSIFMSDCDATRDYPVEYVILPPMCSLLLHPPAKAIEAIEASGGSVTKVTSDYRRLCREQHEESK